MQTYTDRRVIIMTEPEAEEARNVLSKAVVRVDNAMTEAGEGDVPALIAERTALNELAIACGL